MEKYLITHQAAEYLWISKSTLYRMCKDKLIKSTRTVWGQRRFLVQDLDKFINQHSVCESDYQEDADVADWIWEWDFKGSDTKTYTHGIHAYPAMFIPQVARKLISKYSKEGDTVLDIFCGSGTTLVESMLLWRKSIGIELNPLAVKIWKVKTTPIQAEILHSDWQKIFEYAKNTKKAKRENQFYNRDFWFSSEISSRLDIFIEAIKKNSSNGDVEEFFLICLSQIIKTASYSKNGEFKLVRDKSKLDWISKYNLDEELDKIVVRNIEYMDSFEDELKDKKWIPPVIHTFDCSQPLLDEESVDFIVTSPPYGDSKTTVAYGQFSRLSSQFLGLIDWDTADVDGQLLWGKTKNIDFNVLSKSKILDRNYKEIAEIDEKRAKEVLSFYDGLDRVIQNAHKALKKWKYFILIVWNRTVKNILLRTDLIIGELWEQYGFVNNGILYRNILNKRMPSLNSPSNKSWEKVTTMTKESIIILRKVD